MRELTEIRDDIDDIDNQILQLYQKRMNLATDVCEYKIANHKDIFDKKREEEKLKSISQQTTDSFLKLGLEELFEQIMSTSRKKQYQILAASKTFDLYDFQSIPSYDFHSASVVFQGVEGAYSQLAMKKFFGETKNSFHVDTWRDAMEALQSNQADYAVLPIENSKAGAVYENYDLIEAYDCAIIGETILSIEHALLGLKGACLEQITDVYSHPQALMQCSRFLQEQHPNIHVHPMANTAMSAMKVKEDGNFFAAAIADQINASLYDLDIIASEIADDSNNQTRFVIISRNKTFLEKAHCISICFELPNNKGSLYHILSHFAFNGLNMSRIESRPIVGKNWEYRFFIDFEGNLNDDGVRNALLGLKEETSSLRVLGNY